MKQDDIMQTDEMRPCPFCGNSADYVAMDIGKDAETGAPLWAVICGVCEASGPAVEGGPVAASWAWNGCHSGRVH